MAGGAQGLAPKGPRASAGRGPKAQGAGGLGGRRPTGPPASPGPGHLRGPARPPICPQRSTSNLWSRLASQRHQLLRFALREACHRRQQAPLVRIIQHELPLPLPDVGQHCETFCLLHREADASNFFRMPFARVSSPGPSSQRGLGAAIAVAKDTRASPPGACACARARADARTHAQVQVHVQREQAHVHTGARH